MKRLTDNPAAVPIALVVLAVAGGVLRFIVAGQDLFADELATYWIVSTRDLAGVVDTVSTNAEISPPLGFALSWLTTRIELSPELLRLPALLAGIATIPLVYALGTRTVGPGAALLAAALTALSPFMIFYSAEARGYGLMMVMVVLSTLALLLALDSGRRRWWVAYGVFVCLAAYTHYTSVFVLAAQFGWAFWLHPAARKPLLLATAAAALVYIPWLPSLKADLDSPTTAILAALSPFDLDSIRFSLGHWALGLSLFPLRDLPGAPGLLLVAAALAVGGVGLWTTRGRLSAWFAANDRRIILIVALALATPIGEALVSLIGTDTLSTRNLAASWPYLALAFAALITVGRPSLRLTAAALAVIALGVAAAKMLTTDYQRPAFSDAAQFIAEDPRGVVVDAAALTPGPLANFDVEGSNPGVPVFRLSIPEQKQRPFSRADRHPEPAELVGRVVAAADGGPINLVTNASELAFPGAAAANLLATEFVDLLPPGYRPTEREVFPGYFDLQVQTYERDSGSG